MIRRALHSGRRWQVLMLAAVVLSLVAPATLAPPRASAGSLSDQLSAARRRQAELDRSLDRQRDLMDALHRDEADVRAALRETADKLDEINVDQETVRERIARATEALIRVQARHEALIEELRRLDWTIDLLEQELANGEQDLELRRRALGERLAEAYRTQNTSLIEQVFTADSFTDVLTDASAYLAYGDQDRQMAADIARDQASLDSLRLLTTSTRYRTDQLRRAAIESANELTARKKELAEAKRRLAALEARTLRLQERQEAAFERIQRNQAQAKRMIARQAAAERELKRRIASLVRKAQLEAARGRGGASGSLSDGNGRFDWPTTGTVTQEFGCTGFSWEPPKGSCAHFHDGIDIANGSGTPIRAAAAGVVAFVGWNPYQSDPAFIVVMGHTDGFETYYGHLQSRYVVRAGQYVKKGQLIGYMGNTGYSTGTHLHWEVIKNGVNVNPRDYL